MLTTRSVVSIFAAITILLGTGMTSGQNFPNKPIRIVTSVAGGGGDVLARVIGQGISGPLGQPVIIDNRTNIVLAETVAKAPPDGYTMLLVGDVLWVGPLLSGKTDTMKDFSPISMLASDSNIVVVHPSLHVTSIKELIALAKTKPGAPNYASGPVGTTNHLAAELFKHMAGVNIVRIPYKGGAPAVVAVLGGQEAQMYFGNPASFLQHIKSGKLRALAVTSLKRSVVAPDLPTIAESGLPGYEMIGTDSMFAPAKTPVAVINQLNREIVRFLNTPEAKEKILSLGAEVVANSPKEHAEKLKSKMTILGNIIKAAGITPD